MGSLVLVSAGLLWAWAGSGGKPDGCYRIDETTYLAVTDGTVRLIGKHADAARITQADRTRGWVLTLDRPLAHDAAMPSDTKFLQETSAPRASTLMIDERFGEHPNIRLSPYREGDATFPEVPCDRLPQR